MADKFSIWLTSNIKWILTVIVIGVGNYFLIANQITINTGHIKDNSKSIVKIQKELPKLRDKDITTLSILKEIKFNLKRQMKKQGMEYIEDTNLGTK